ncbi:putative ferric-chelate reductase 1 [Amia ocellicauda]|uniref:putative ferric-chelate reductase 1 n=1 Tax=Amia ocellicauda TaxID=2972642 RepID=UPI003464BA6A
MHPSTLCLFLLISGNLIEDVMGYPNGAVTAACTDMKPIHQSFTAQSSTSPFRITASKSTYSPGDEITVTLQTSSVPFEGFLLQARTIGGVSAVGLFTPLNLTESQGLSCNGVANSAVSHTSDSQKTELHANWTAPRNVNLGNITFSATFVQNLSIFWLNVRSDSITSTSSASVILEMAQYPWLTLSLMSMSFFFRK